MLVELKIQNLFRKINKPEHENKALGRYYEKCDFINEANHYTEKDSVF